MPVWLESILYIVILLAYGRFVLWFDRYRNQREQKKFLMFMHVQFPDAVLTYRSASGKSEHDAFQKLIASMQGDIEDPPS